MLFNILLARTRMLCFFFLFLVVISNFKTIPVVKEKIKVKLAPVIPTGPPITVVKEITDTPRLVAEEQLKLYLCNQMQQHMYLIFYYVTFFL